MEAAIWIGIGALALVGLGFVGFIGMLVFGYWQHIRAGRKTYKAIEREPGE